jgi:hypothetical protein
LAIPQEVPPEPMSFHTNNIDMQEPPIHSELFDPTTIQNNIDAGTKKYRKKLIRKKSNENLIKYLLDLAFCNIYL